MLIFFNLILNCKLYIFNIFESITILNFKNLNFNYIFLRNYINLLLYKIKKNNKMTKMFILLSKILVLVIIIK